MFCFNNVRRTKRQRIDHFKLALFNVCHIACVNDVNGCVFIQWFGQLSIFDVSMLAEMREHNCDKTIKKMLAEFTFSWAFLQYWHRHDPTRTQEKYHRPFDWFVSANLNICLVKWFSFDCWWFSSQYLSDIVLLGRDNSNAVRKFCIPCHLLCLMCPIKTNQIFFRNASMLKIMRKTNKNKAKSVPNYENQIKQTWSLSVHMIKWLIYSILTWPIKYRSYHHFHLISIVNWWSKHSKHLNYSSQRNFYCQPSGSSEYPHYSFSFETIEWLLGIIQSIFN